jgi:hypothetical protein
MSVISLSSPGLRGGSVCGGGVVWRCEIGTAPISSGISGFQNRIAVVVEQRLFILTCHHVTTLWHSVTILRQAFNEPSVHFYSLCQSLWPVTDPFCSVCDCCVTRQCGLVWIYTVFRWVSMCLAQHLEHVLSRLSWHCFNMWCSTSADDNKRRSGLTCCESHSHTVQQIWWSKKKLGMPCDAPRTWSILSTLKEIITVDDDCER